MARCVLREVRFSEIHDAVAFADGQGSMRGREGLNHGLSLMALNDDGEPVAAGLMYELPNREFVLEISLRSAEDSTAEDGLSSRIVDKCLMKAASRGIGRIRIHILQAEEEKGFFKRSDWLVPERGEPDFSSLRTGPAQPGATEADGKAGPSHVVRHPETAMRVLDKKPADESSDPSIAKSDQGKQSERDPVKPDETDTPSSQAA